MRTAIRLISAFFILFFAACNNKSKVNLTETTARDEVPTLGNLIFTFDKNLAADSVFNEWDTTEYIHFEPPISGRFRWLNANELIFSPEYDLLPATEYKATITDKILRHTGSKYSLGKCEVKPFHTPYLNLENALAVWNVSDGSTGNAFPQVDLYFNYKVSPEKLKQFVSLSADGAAKDFNIQTTTPELKISLSLTGVPLEDRDVKLKLTIEKGLLPLNGKTGLGKAIENELLLPSPFNVVVQNIEANHDGTQGSIKLFMSQTPASENIQQFIAIEPKVNFKTETSSQGLVITSEGFDVSKAYSITLKQGLKGKIGGTLKEDYTNTVTFGKLQPSVQFINRKGVYLGSKGNRNIEVNVTSVSRIKVIISKIYENNLLASERSGYYPNDSYYESDYESEEYYYENDYYYDEAVWGDIIYEKVIETKTLPRYGNSRLLKFNIEDKLKDLKGIYHIKVRSMDDYWRSDSRFVSLSDIGLIAREGKDNVLVFANSIQNAKAISGVNVSVYGSNNQLVGTGVTDADGVAKVDLKKREFSGFKPALITATNGTDFNYMPLRSTMVGTSRFDVGGKRNNSTNLDAFIYAEREMYRPGEKVNLSVVVRDWKWNKPGEIPLKMKMLLPNGKELKAIRKSLNAQGSLEAQVELSASAVTGSYTFEVYSANDILMATKNILVEEFMPDRIKVSASLDKPFLKPGETVTLSLNAVNFFGPPAANRNYEVEIQTKEKTFSAEKYRKYNFSLADRNTYYNSQVMQGTTDENGNATETYTVPENYANSGLMQLDFFTTVFDETGRPVNRKSVIDVFTQDVFYGLGTDGYYYYRLNQNISFPLIALDKDGKPLTAKARVQVIKHDYHTYLSRYGEYFRYDSRREDKTIVDREVDVSGENSVFTFAPTTPGQYEIRVGKPGVNSYVRSTFYSYGSWGSSRGSFEVSNEGNVDIELDKKSYYSDEKVRALFKTPFNGKLLVTVETDRVLEYKYIDVANRSASLELNLSSQYLPNAYITATLIKPHAESDMPLTVAHGFKAVTVEEKSRKMNVEIVAEKNVRSRTKQKVKVKATPGAKVTLAAVDEGILQITGYKTPDPYGFFYAKRALEINAYDLYPLLFPELKGNLSSVGGDGFDLSKRTNPMQNKRVKLVSYWSGIADVNSSGEANFEFDIPQFSGQLRLMAVAYKDAAFGSTDFNMTVADPVVVSTALPRFLSPKDTVLMPVTISNTTKNATEAKVNVKLNGPVQMVGSSSQSVSLKANSEGRVKFLVVAEPKIDVAKITVEVNALNEKFVEETDITIRPAASLQKRTGAGSINAGESKNVSFDMDYFMPASAGYQLVISKNPVVEIADQIYRLVQYPYGCTEQTISAAFPQLYFGDLSEQFNMDKNIKTGANYNVQEAIRKIKMRQLYSGGLTLWDSEGSESWWATVYAAHFLLEARKSGFEVDNSLTETIYSYLINRLKSKETINYYYNRNQNKKIAPKEVAYSLYVLALAGKPQVSTMNYYKQNPQLLALDSKYLLSAAYAISGNKAKFNEMLPASFTGEAAVRETGGSFSSDVRDEAIALNAILEVDPDNPQVGIMAKHVSTEIKARPWLSTQDRAFSFLALGKIARQAAKSDVKATVKVNGKQVAANDGSTLKLTAKQLGGTNVEVSVSGSGKLYYFWQAEGISKDGSFKEEDSYIKIRKRFYDRYGKQITNNTFTQNDLVVVALTLENSYSTYIDNIVITDMLPAGFEIENPRTKEIPGMNWIKNESYPTHTDMRDDRINLFVNLGISSQTYYYAVRAVSPGTYVMGPAMADAMYNGEYHSYNGSGVMRVKER
ncbi:MAG: alpha-2-macroglobulin family protein [Chitinophagales bacterium]|nr:alpha-2-macroglobulin family protein [Chitinophagales bacterium]